MGFSDWTYGPEAETAPKNYELMYRHSDIVCFQFNDGIPWPEAYAGEPYAPELEQTIARRLEYLPQGHKVYLEIAALNMMRNGIAGYRGLQGSMPLPPPWDTYAFDDEPVVTAYSNFCIDVINRFQPDFVNYSLEGTGFLLSNPDRGEEYAAFHKQVYQRIKAAHRNVPLCVSAPMPDPDSPRARRVREGLALLLPYMDFLAGSCYPFAFWRRPDAGNPSNLSETWFSQLVDMAGGKPVAMGETNWIAEDLVIPAFKFNIAANPVFQNEYLSMLLDEADKANALFVIWWSVADFDRLWETFSEDVKDVGRVWRDTGLYNEDLEPRPALDTWDQWLARKVE